MIRHRPAGRGHAYALEPDQRVPVLPRAGEPVELRATTTADVKRVEVELAGGRRLALACVADASAEAVPGDGHLAAAAARGGTNRLRWAVELPPPAAGERLRYRLREHGPQGTRQTRWHAVGAAEWRADGGRLELLVSGDGADALRRRIGAAEWLVAAGRVHGVRVALPLDPDAHVVGFGERFDALDQRGRTPDVVVWEEYKRQGARTYLPQPFGIVTGARGYGLHVDTDTRLRLDVGAALPDRLVVEAELDPEDEPVLRIRLHAGPPAEALSVYLEHTGPPALPPDWVFAPWMSGNEWNTQARVLAEVERSLAEDVPVGVVVIEAWSDESTFAAFGDAVAEPDPEGGPRRLADFELPAGGAWPDPAGLVRRLHELGVRVLLWQIPLVRARPAPGCQGALDEAVMLRRGYAVQRRDGRPYRNRGWWFPGSLLLDFSNPQARSWWLERRRYLLDDVGIDGFKTDGGEHAWGDDLRLADGTRGGAVRNRYPQLYAEAYHQLLAESGVAGATFSRAGFTGASRTPCHWAGDEDSTWEAFRASVTAGITAGLSGILFWGWDLAGFSGEVPSAELYLRSAAMACLCPVMQYHSEFNHHRLPSRDRTPWNVADRTGEPQALSGYRRFAQLRQRLRPYLEAQARLAVERRTALMRALVLDFPDDPEIWRWPLQYLLGEDLLVAPVTEPGASTWRVYLPAGSWRDAFTGERHEGPAVLERAAPLDVIPAFVRGAWADRLLSAFGDG